MAAGTRAVIQKGETGPGEEKQIGEWEVGLGYSAPTGGRHAGVLAGHGHIFLFLKISKENCVFTWNLLILYVHLNFKQTYCMDQTSRVQRAHICDLALIPEFHHFLGLISSVGYQWLLSDFAVGCGCGCGLGWNRNGSWRTGKGRTKAITVPAVKVEHLQDNKLVPCRINLYIGPVCEFTKSLTVTSSTKSRYWRPVLFSKHHYG